MHHAFVGPFAAAGKGAVFILGLPVSVQAYGYAGKFWIFTDHLKNIAMIYGPVRGKYQAYTSAIPVLIQVMETSGQEKGGFGIQQRLAAEKKNRNCFVASASNDIGDKIQGMAGGLHGHERRLITRTASLIKTVPAGQIASLGEVNRDCLGVSSHQKALLAGFGFQMRVGSLLEKPDFLNQILAGWSVSVAAGLKGFFLKMLGLSDSRKDIMGVLGQGV